MSSVALRFFALLLTLHLLPTCRARITLCKSIDRKAEGEAPMAGAGGAQSLIFAHRIGGGKLAGKKNSNASTEGWSSLRQLKARVLKEHPRFDLDYAGPRTHAPSHN